MEVALLAVVEVGVRLPDPRQHANAEGQGVLVSAVGQATIYPSLSEVAVHGVSLKRNPICKAMSCYYYSFLPKAI